MTELALQVQASIEGNKFKKGKGKWMKNLIKKPHYKMEESGTQINLLAATIIEVRALVTHVEVLAVFVVNFFLFSMLFISFLHEKNIIFALTCPCPQIKLRLKTS